MMTVNVTSSAADISSGTKFKRIALARGGAEFVSIGCGFGGMVLAKSLLQEPLDPVKDYVAKYLVRPYLGAYETVLDKLPSLHTPDDKAEVEGMNPKQRARHYASGMVDFAAVISAGFAGQIGGQMLFDRLSKVPEMSAKGHLRIASYDRVAQMGAVLALNTILATPAIELQRNISSMLGKTFGMQKDHADDQASFLVNWQLPNIAGITTAILAHYKESKTMIWK
jgi:hypothetical protein